MSSTRNRSSEQSRLRQTEWLQTDQLLLVLQPRSSQNQIKLQLHCPKIRWKLVKIDCKFLVNSGELLCLLTPKQRIRKKEETVQTREKWGSSVEKTEDDVMKMRSNVGEEDGTELVLMLRKRKFSVL